MAQKALEVARDIERIISANRYTLIRQPSHTGIPQLVTLAEDLVRILEKAEHKTYGRT